MATIPRIPKKAAPPPPPPVYTIEQMTAFGWLSNHVSPLDGGGFAIPRTPDPRIPSGIDPRIPRKDQTP
jgi:hypothetical protein